MLPGLRHLYTSNVLQALIHRSELPQINSYISLMNEKASSESPQRTGATSSNKSPETAPLAPTPNMVIAPVAKGIIIVSSLVVAAGIALYENPQVREWVLNGRRKIAVALEDLAGEIRPYREEPSETTHFTRSRDARESPDNVEMARRITGTDVVRNSVRRRIQAQDEPHDTSQDLTLSGNAPALFPFSQTVSTSTPGDTLPLQSQSVLDRTLPPYSESMPQGDSSEELDNTVMWPSLSDSQIPVRNTPFTPDHNEQENTTPITTSSGLGFAGELNCSFPKSPETERDTDFVSDAGTETASNIEYDDVSEMGGWSEVGSVSGDEDMLLGSSTQHV